MAATGRRDRFPRRVLRGRRRGQSRTEAPEGSLRAAGRGPGSTNPLEEAGGVLGKGAALESHRV